MIKLPGLIDPHVHLRDPGQTDKEDFYTGTVAAIFGGFTTVLDMPNNKIPIFDKKTLDEKINIAKEKIVCNVGFYFGSLGNNLNEFKKIRSNVFGLKIFLNQTTGNFIVDQKVFQTICYAWPKSKPILVHAEEDILEEILQIGERTGQKIHVCHVSSKSELSIIINAKENGQHVTCGVTPHHLFLNEHDAKTLGVFGKMKPYLKSKKDQEFLWKNLQYIDMVESDHAPHTIEEKESENPPFGVPGLETTLPLLLTKLEIEKIIQLCFDNPKKIFGIPNQPNTYIEVDEKETYEIKNENLHTKAQWSPFAGWNVKGKVVKVAIKGKTVMENDTLLVKAGEGSIIKP